MAKRLPIVQAPAMDFEMLEAVRFDRRPRLSMTQNETAQLSAELARDPALRDAYLEAPWKFFADRGISLDDRHQLGTTDGMQLTSEVCTAVAVCNAAYLLNVWAAENVVQVQKAVNVELAYNVAAVETKVIVSGEDSLMAHEMPKGLSDTNTWV